MRQINGMYTERFNRVHKYDGQLFRGRIITGNQIVIPEKDKGANYSLTLCEQIS
jgi:hypothetical protein